MAYLAAYRPEINLRLADGDAPEDPSLTIAAYRIRHRWQVSPALANRIAELAGIGSEPR